MTHQLTCDWRVYWLPTQIQSLPAVAVLLSYTLSSRWKQKPPTKISFWLMRLTTKLCQAQKGNKPTSCMRSLPRSSEVIQVIQNTLANLLLHIMMQWASSTISRNVPVYHCQLWLAPWRSTACNEGWEGTGPYKLAPSVVRSLPQAWQRVAEETTWWMLSVKSISNSQEKQQAYLENQPHYRGPQQHPQQLHYYHRDKKKKIFNSVLSTGPKHNDILCLSIHDSVFQCLYFTSLSPSHMVRASMVVTYHNKAYWLTNKSCLI